MHGQPVYTILYGSPASSPSCSSASKQAAHYLYVDRRSLIIRTIFDQTRYTNTSREPPPMPPQPPLLPTPPPPPTPPAAPRATCTPRRSGSGAGGAHCGARGGSYQARRRTRRHTELMPKLPESSTSSRRSHARGLSAPRRPHAARVPRDLGSHLAPPRAVQTSAPSRARAIAAARP